MRFLVCSVLSLVLMVGQASADIMLTTTPGLSWDQDSGIQSFQLFAQGDIGDPGILALISTVTIDSGTPGVGIFTSPISFASNFNATNVNGAGSSGNLDAGDSRIAYLALDFTGAQVIPSGAPGVFGTFSFNVNGLTPGTYDILLTDSFSDGPTVNVTNGSFTITAVPEPSSLVLLGCVGFAGVCYSRRRLISNTDAENIAV